MFNNHARHRKVCWIAGCELGTRQMGGRGDKTVRLRKRYSSSGESTSPNARLPCFLQADIEHPEAFEQPAGCVLLTRFQPPNHFLDVDGTHQGKLSAAPQPIYPIRRRPGS
jgi:hypothetical protein